MDATLPARRADTSVTLPSFVTALIVALAGLILLAFSTAFGQTMADAAVSAAGGSLAEGRYTLLLQLNADAARYAGAVLLAVGTFVALRRS